MISLDDSFTELNLEDELRQQYPVVHIASHFVFSPGDDADSYLLLAGKNSPGKGYHLTLAELRDDPNLTFQKSFELLTLSACETGTVGSRPDGRGSRRYGNPSPEEGCEVGDRHLVERRRYTAVLMAEFYRRWMTSPGITKIEALRASQSALLHGDEKR